jgi:protein SCO1/2
VSIFKVVQNMSIKNKSIIVIAAVTAMSAGFWFSSIQQSNNKETAESVKQEAHDEALAEARKKFSPIQGAILSPARKISVPTLTKDDGDAFTQNDLAGHWSLIFFGYTHCPDVCPITMGVAAQAKKLALANNQEFPEVFFISVDPDRDKVEILAEYVQYFDKDFVGVTGDESLIKALTLQMSVVYMKMSSSDENYVVDHSSALLLLNPEGRLAAFMNPPHDPKVILKDLEKVMSLQ